MTSWLSCLLLLSCLRLVAAVPTAQVPFQQPGSSDPVEKPYRSLPWGDINILHTTDTHGWLGGHTATGSEASFSGDWGDLYSFVHRMKELARQRNVDLLVVDSGDRVDGNGLVDAQPPPHTKGYSALHLWREMPYDIVTTGNHELYRNETAQMTKTLLADYYGEKYVTSNVNLTTHGRSQPLGRMYRKFKTEQGRKVTAFGILFDFKAKGAGIDVVKPSDMVNLPWFRQAIADEPDFFLLVGHMSIRLGDSEWTQVVQAIRTVHPTTPVLIFGGHHHEDSHSMSLASGRYMETVGFMSVSDVNAEEPPRFERRYIDQNRNSYAYHAGSEYFDTDKGRRISRGLADLSSSFNLTKTYGFAPHSFYLSRFPLRSEMSIFSLLTANVLPNLLVRPDRPAKPMVILNTGSVRFDIFKGPFTRNDQWIMQPFANNFLYVKDVPTSLARRVLPYLNIVGEHGFAAADVEQHYQRSLKHAAASHALTARSNRLTLGYVTKDACPGLGDDTLHKPFPYVPQPIFVSTELDDRDRKVDIVFLDFIKIDIVMALNKLQHDRTYSDSDVDLYVKDLSANTLMQTYAERYWNA